MTRRTRQAAVILTCIALTGALGAASGWILAQYRMNRTVTVAVRPVQEVDDDAARARGKYLFASRGCAHCHGAEGTGRVFLDSPDGLRVRGPNLTRGSNSAVADYRVEDWDRAIRHGVSPRGRPLLIMPSDEYNRLTDTDLAALLAFIRSLPARPGERAVIELPPLATLAYGFGILRDAAAKIDHGLPPSPPVPEGITAAHGRYVASVCFGCHGPRLEGGRIPGAPPDWPPAPALTPGEGGALQRYPDAASLARMFRSGRRADGTAIQVMPFESLRELSDTDVSALHLFLRTLPDSAK